ncbi:hypothetical protein [Escherichia coli]|uniref:hypothetical protein n=1 Tax=Escherichia coli TaxID=562 RepID=UPI001E3936CD|nr:hypothetical protein [Escherichia coli]
MNTIFTIDDLDDLPPDVKQIFKAHLSKIRFTKDAEHTILLLLKSVYKGDISEILLANIIKRCLGLNNVSETAIINDTTVKNIINEEITTLNTAKND